MSKGLAVMETGTVESEEDVFRSSFLSGNSGVSRPWRRSWVVVALCAGIVTGGVATKTMMGSAHSEQSVSLDTVTEKYSWKDSNVALFGSETEKTVKKEAADQERAWAGAGQKPGLLIWRIEKFKVVAVPKADYGKFHSGDSYIILHTFRKEGKLKDDVHFWIGKYSSQDEYGTAAYKTVELDTKLDDRPTQHRELQNHESDLFKSYFDKMTILSGGVDSGFKRVLPEAFEARLFEIKKEGRKKTVAQIPMKKGNLKSENAYIIDNGDNVYQWNGAQASHDVRFFATQHALSLMEGRRRKPTWEVLQESRTSSNHPAMKLLKGAETKEPHIIKVPSQMFKLVDGDLKELTDMAKDNLNSDYVFIVSTTNGIWIWVGKAAHVDDRRNAMTYASRIATASDAPFRPITFVAEGKETAAFLKAVS